MTTNAQEHFIRCTIMFEDNPEAKRIKIRISPNVKIVKELKKVLITRLDLEGVYYIDKICFSANNDQWIDLEDEELLDSVRTIASALWIRCKKMNNHVGGDKVEGIKIIPMPKAKKPESPRTSEVYPSVVKPTPVTPRANGNTVAKNTPSKLSYVETNVEKTKESPIVYKPPTESTPQMNGPKNVNLMNLINNTPNKIEAKVINLVDSEIEEKKLSPATESKSSLEEENAGLEDEVEDKLLPDSPEDDNQKLLNKRSRESLDTKAEAVRKKTRVSTAETEALNESEETFVIVRDENNLIKIKITSNTEVFIVNNENEVLRKVSVSSSQPKVVPVPEVIEKSVQLSASSSNSNKMDKIKGWFYDHLNESFNIDEYAPILSKITESSSELASIYIDALKNDALCHIIILAKLHKNKFFSENGLYNSAPDAFKSVLPNTQFTKIKARRSYEFMKRFGCAPLLYKDFKMTWVYDMPINECKNLLQSLDHSVKSAYLEKSDALAKIFPSLQYRTL
ncbi:hypothetical protein ROZALSC1DRAFT_31309 [Rozella allomycis CSF55]|uniref:Uncharacterized protein n=1 Tax=Rozella allomycis (strain CSF55) TaxID=988480 RepID=A0A075ARQ6_ROZAC|nr:hypothetical protein O9G_002841 [Rozella allomycis CSF55]RKP16834.1 hypothetical protein ROZALSC1DRAFT_31309 [Rozella allomycis CSF55]|eukprot:EPZ32923.1 hypothetical protein O9G_002841 [Rozella allomycis CSF55]